MLVMRLRYLPTVTLLLFASFVSGSESLQTGVNSTFVPTAQWQKVSPGQAIPPGLHVRFNFETNTTEAKLFVPEANETTSKRHGAVVVRDNQLLLDVVNVSGSSDDGRETRKRFRSYAQLKSDFAAMRTGIKTDAELMDGIFEQMARTDVDRHKLPSLFSDLIYLLHQVDNAQDFVKKRRLPMLLYYMHDTDAEIRRLACSAVGAAVQSNDKVKIAAVESGLLQLLSTFLNGSVSDGPNANLELVSSYLLTLGALLRHFPLAQEHFFGTTIPVGENNTYALLINLLESTNWNREQNQLARKIRIRTLTLVGDIYTERLEVLDKQRAEQYVLVPFEQSLQAIDWCGRLQTTLISELGTDESGKVDHDVCEKVLTAAKQMAPLCGGRKAQQTFTTAKVRSVLASLRSDYQKRVSEETDETDSFFYDMLHLVQQVQHDFLREDTPAHKEEL